MHPEYARIRHQQLFRQGKSAYTPRAEHCYIEAAIASIHYFGLKNAIVFCYYPRVSKYEIIQIKDSKIKNPIAQFVHYPTLFESTNTIGSLQPLDEVLWFLGGPQGSDYSNNLVFCSDAEVCVPKAELHP